MTQRERDFYRCRWTSRRSWCKAWCIYHLILYTRIYKLIKVHYPKWWHFSISQYRAGGEPQIFWCNWSPYMAKHNGWCTEKNPVVLPRHHKQ